MTGLIIALTALALSLAATTAEVVEVRRMRAERRERLIALDDITVGWVENGPWVLIDDDLQQHVAAGLVRQLAADVRQYGGLPALAVTTDQMLAGWQAGGRDVTCPEVTR